MYCLNPQFIGNYGFIACRKCLHCRLNEKKAQSDRLIIERLFHKYCWFVTLTYSPENYPMDECLHREHLHKYLKRLRKSLPGVKFMYFYCGEYGDESGRAHYHLAVYSDVNLFRPLIDAWSIDGVPIGRVSVDQLSTGRCKYIAGYVVKKMTKKDDKRLDGRTPEFTGGSRRPAIGYNFLLEILDTFHKVPSFKEGFISHTYCPTFCIIRGQKVRIPRYVRDKLKAFFNDKEHIIKRQEIRRCKFAEEVSLLKNVETPLSDLHLSPRAFWHYIQDEYHLFDDDIKIAEKVHKRNKRKIL